MKQIITLIGMMGSGKSTIGELLAAKYTLPFIDTDTLIEVVAGMPISDIFQQHGEQKFRDMERDALQKALQKFAADEGGVIATGGGIVLNPDNRAMLQQNKTCVYLAADLPTLYARIADTQATRPLLKHANALEDMLKLRDPLYRETAHSIVLQKADDTPKSVVDKIVQLLK